jgi:hypothetical protein
MSGSPLDAEVIAFQRSSMHGLDEPTHCPDSLLITSEALGQKAGSIGTREHLEALRANYRVSPTAAQSRPLHVRYAVGLQLSFCGTRLQRPSVCLVTVITAQRFTQKIRKIEQNAVRRNTASARPRWRRDPNELEFNESFS